MLVLFFGLATSTVAQDLPPPLRDGDFIRFDPDQARLGQLLFYDKILSGNQNISCATCHNVDLAGTDGLSLGIGEGGVGSGPKRTAGTGSTRILRRVPRNAPGLWNLGHRDIRSMFADGRIEISEIYGNGYSTPAQEYLPQGLETLLAAQALFPLASETEMAGQPGENEVAGAANDRIDMVWPILAKRVREIDRYGQLFVAAFEHIEKPSDVTIVEIANALAAFIATEWRNFDSPFDRYLAGDKSALTPKELRGMSLFYGKMGCSGCHAGPLLSDQSFRAQALPQFGPGRTRPHDPLPRDVGRLGKTDDLADAYRFRVPFLRNVALTAPYGHNGAMPTLEAMLRHHFDPIASNQTWTPDMANLPPAPWLGDTDFVIRQDKLETARRLAQIDIDLPAATDQEIADIIAFLESLTGETALQRPMGRPKTVPSGLPVD